MAAKKPARPKKFKQARSAAKADAKKAFSGKSQARLKDTTLKLEAIDKQALSDVSKEAKAGYITDERGNKINVKPTETPAERFAREHTRPLDEFRSQMREEGLYKGKKAETAKAEKPAGKKPAVKKAAVKKTAATTTTTKKPAVKKVGAGKYAAGRTTADLSPAGKAKYDALIKDGVNPKSALNKALFADTKGKKPAAAKVGKSTKATGKTVAQRGAKAPATTGPKYVQSTRVNAPSASKAVAVRGTTGKQVATIASKAAKVGKFAKFAKLAGGPVGIATTIASLAAEPLFDKLSREAKQGKAVAAGGTAGVRGGSTTGFVPKKKKIGTAINGVSMGIPKATAQGKTISGAGGSTTNIYRVQHGDTFSSIAQRAGVPTKELQALNKNKKLFRNTAVKIPAKGKVPTPMYTGPVPYRAPKKK